MYGNKLVVFSLCFHAPNIDGVELNWLWSCNGTGLVEWNRIGCAVYVYTVELQHSLTVGADKSHTEGINHNQVHCAEGPSWDRC